MFGVELLCSDPECAEAVEAVGALAELDALVCECGCTLEIMTVWEVREERLPERTLEDDLPLAA